MAGRSVWPTRPSLRHPIAPSQVEGERTGKGSSSLQAGGEPSRECFQPVNQNAELQGSTAGIGEGVRTLCLRQFCNT